MEVIVAWNTEAFSLCQRSFRVNLSTSAVLSYTTNSHCVCLYSFTFGRSRVRLVTQMLLNPAVTPPPTPPTVCDSELNQPQSVSHTYCPTHLSQNVVTLPGSTLCTNTLISNTIGQRLPNFYVCDPKVANGKWPATLPSKRQQSAIFTVNVLILSFVEHYVTLRLVKKY